MVKRATVAATTRTRKETSEPETANANTTVDWNSLEAKYQDLNAMLNAPSYGLNASQARQKQKQQVEQAMEALLEMAQAEARRLLVEGDAKSSVEGGLRTLKLKEAYYGTGSLQLVTCYFHLARTHQYLDKYKQAEEFLSLAQWTILRHPECDTVLKAELYQTFGLLYASDGKLDLALKHLAQATYYLTLLYGPHHILTSFGYFDIGNVFAARTNMDNAMAFYEKVKDVWFTHLEKVFSTDATLEAMDHKHAETFGQENVQDALKMLCGIVGLQTERFGLVHPSTGKAELILALYYRWIGDDRASQESMERTLEIHKRVYGLQHPTTSRIRTYASDFGYQLPSDTTHALDPKPQQSQSQPQPQAQAQPAQGQPEPAGSGSRPTTSEEKNKAAAAAVEEVVVVDDVHEGEEEEEVVVVEDSDPQTVAAATAAAEASPSPSPSPSPQHEGDSP